MGVVDSGAGTSGDAAVIWSEDFLAYKWAHTHPMSPVRLALTMSLASGLGVLDGVRTTEPLPVGDDLLMSVHTRAYVDAVRAVSNGMASLSGPLLERLFGLGSADNPVFYGMHEAGSMLVGGSVAAAAAIASGKVRRAVNIGGGMHHALPGRASGFCIYNDCSIAIKYLLEHGYDRIAYIDVDAHHGDGVQLEFNDDPRVLTISIHQHPATLWPGTGWPAEVGGDTAAGTAVNIPMMPGTPDRLWLRAFHAVVPGALAEFSPQVIVSQVGCDSHQADPLTDLSLTIEGQVAAMRAMRGFAEKYSEGRWLTLGGGGYGVVNVVPRAWTHLLATVLDRDLDPATRVSADWLETATELSAEVHADYARPPVATMGDGGDVDYRPWEGPGGEEPPPGISDAAQRQADRAILATRRAVYPLIGLDPEDPRD